MKQRKQAMKSPLYAALVILIVGVLATAAPASAGRAPAGRTYFVVTIGLSPDSAEAYELDVGCVRFTPTAMCDTDGECGTWWRVEGEKLKRRSGIGFDFDLIDDESGLPIKVEGFGRIDSRGPRSSLAGAAIGREETTGVSINFAIAGRAVGAARCRQLVDDFEAERQ